MLPQPRGCYFAISLGFIAFTCVNASPQSLELYQDTQIPPTDLGYAVYRPTSVNHTGQYYNFSNIRYAAPPLGNLRFANPEPPIDERSKGIQDGTTGFVCPQAQAPGWAESNARLGPEGQVIPAQNSSLPESEDCLFLDVMVPINVYKNSRSKLAPVLINIHGGGFFIGDKQSLYDSQGLLAASKNGVIFVSMNYRLTAFGFLGSLETGAGNDTSPNAGLLDQRAALKWVNRYIKAFGGDPNQVTIMGESGGGTSVLFHTTAYGASKPAENNLFVRALGQSPGAIVTKPKSAQAVSNAFLKELGVSTADEARRLPTDVLIKANQKVEASLGGWGPIVDGDLIPDIPSRLYTSGRYIKNLVVMAGHNSNEAALFVDPTNQNTQAAFDAFLSFFVPSATSAQLSYINNTLYPPPSSTTSQSYTDQYGRLALLDADAFNVCWTVLLASVYAPKAHNYIFSVPPGFHAQDLSYTFYNGFGYQVNTTVAKVLQGYVANFALTGDPNAAGLPQFPAWAPDLETVEKDPLRAFETAKVVNLTNSGFPVVNEDAAKRCGWWFESNFAGSN